ncbi:MAG: NAD-dependent epimerase/dehydratase family protein [Gammaproteobacteria bacterium]|uniref:2-alkyl-3-oxoalkanoate reductase n=1 Tax=Shewanella hafniensis TaxID=365590 RepID=UPI001BBFF882|nr:2-alkyl-3-oxoalkanoate reductase [Shewanella hafniensis]MBU1393197.1 NAD-dependent epimerase/dehydratase family protein [Gammaproteobacteria bacterium]MBU1478161.1 NAD-dependent epimerase/dehydratase family protein [Gammaproteobacteria bacterium]MBU2002918.1 NAD-dependent epimerase/dehydratase family protein [Gammaproteobacteria bacterium]MBU2130701.1 NAD-dependent epimerase/dehydratase family protein [Gammaproteobacteria bacterium]MBU2185844.1 NAD-dependent epimerase/dehydratase family pro
MTINPIKSTTLAQFDAAEQTVLVQLALRVQHAFVTGAGGFLGKAICLRLLAAGIKVTGFSRGHYPELEALGVVMLQGDLVNKDQLQQAMQGCDIVFHVASKAGVWGDRDSYFCPNVKGAANVIAACKALKIDKLVYTSTPSVTFAGQDESGIDESTPYATRFLNYYAHSKAIAEKMVLDANQAGDMPLENTGVTQVSSQVTTQATAAYALKTVALRPHLIWGPGDPHLVPRVLARGRLDKLKLVGREDKLVDTIYIDNAAYAHVLAALELCQAKPKCQGKAYFLSNDEPITMAKMLNLILACDALPPVTKRVPQSVAYVAGAVLETVYFLLKKQEEPMMTRFVARQLSCSHYFDISAAKRDLGYRALVSINEGMARLKASL